MTTGDEASSYTEADERLRLWLRRRRFNKSGTIPALEEKLTAINNKLAHIESALDDTASMRLEAERLKKRQAELNGEIAAWKRYDAYLSILQAQENIERARSVHADIYRELGKSSYAPTEADISAIRSDLKALEPLKTLLSAEQKRLKERPKRIMKKSSIVKKVPVFDGADAALAVSKAVLLSEVDTRKTSPTPARPAIIWAYCRVITAPCIRIRASQIVPKSDSRPAGAGSRGLVSCLVNYIWRIIKHRVYMKELSRASGTV